MLIRSRLSKYCYTFNLNKSNETSDFRKFYDRKFRGNFAWNLSSSTPCRFVSQETCAAKFSLRGSLDVPRYIRKILERLHLQFLMNEIYERNLEQVTKVFER